MGKRNRESSSSSDSSHSSSSSSSSSVTDKKVLPIKHTINGSDRKSSKKPKARDPMSSNDSSASSETDNLKLPVAKDNVEPKKDKRDKKEKKDKKDKKDKIEPLISTPVKQVKEEVENFPTNSVPSSSSSTFFVEVLCEFADMINELAAKTAVRTGVNWKPGRTSSKKTIYRDPNEPKRPPTSAYILWSEHMRKKLKEEFPNKPVRLTDLADLWKGLDQRDKSVWERAAKDKRDGYQQQLEAYRNSTPKHG